MKWHKNFKVVSFYTPDYAKHAHRLIASLNEHNIRHEIAAIPQRKWAKATNFKAEFIRNRLTCTDVPLVWIDADATVEVELVFPSVDFAIYARFADRLRRTHSPFRTGTVYFANTPLALDLAARWHAESETQADGIDQWSLWRAWQAAMADKNYMPTTLFLPLRYCQKKDEVAGFPPLIKHYMASRTLKRAK